MRADVSRSPRYGHMTTVANVLVVSTVEHPEHILRSHLDEEDMAYIGATFEQVLGMPWSKN